MSDEGRPAATVGEQTDEWIRQRLGKVTASRVYDVVKKLKDGRWSAARQDYAIELLAERMSGMRQEPFLSAAMLWGVEAEHQAKLAYRRRTDSLVNDVGFVEHERIPMTGASPDALVDDDGLLEIKCPNMATHVEFLISREIEPKYLTQMQWQMACTGRSWCDFVSYDFRMMSERFRLVVKRVDRDPPLIKELEKLVTEFLSGLTRVEARLNGDIGPSSEDVAASLDKVTPVDWKGKK